MCNSVKGPCDIKSFKFCTAYDVWFSRYRPFNMKLATDSALVSLFINFLWAVYPFSGLCIRYACDPQFCSVYFMFMIARVVPVIFLLCSWPSRPVPWGFPTILQLWVAFLLTDRRSNGCLNGIQLTMDDPNANPSYPVSVHFMADTISIPWFFPNLMSVMDWEESPDGQMYKTW